MIDARNVSLRPTHNKPTIQMEALSKQIEETDNIIIGMGVHCYSINDSLKILLDNTFKKAIGKFMAYYVQQEEKKLFIYYASYTDMYE